MDLKDRRSILFLAIAFFVGWAIGLIIFGWNLTPVTYKGAGFQHLREQEQNQFLVTMAEMYALTNDSNYIVTIFGSWNEPDATICELAIDAGTNPAQQQKLNNLATVLNEGLGCADVAAAANDQAETVAADEGGRSTGLNIALICGLLLVLGAIVGAIFLLWQRRSQQSGGGDNPNISRPLDSPIVEAADSDQPVTPLARFETTYVRGHDTYDDSFSIENAEGDFLGECGVGLSETIGADMPKNVTAFEVWLFDKNDIRTVTKVAMSDHAFFDEAIKAKLAPKGEPMLARPEDVIVLETASLIVNALITDMEYGTGTLPPQSFFERITIELSAWAKEGDFAEPDVQGRVDDLLDY
ncbi:MAG TPA: hypothetical protein VFI27_14060 [candidate division Zixibacteria bacterium]|nr:hypothetical protein [candidate division Zixibacteria bacterium]